MRSSTTAAAAPAPGFLVSPTLAGATAREALFQFGRLARHENDITRMDRVMDDAVSAGSSKRTRHLGSDAQDGARRHRALHLDPVFRGRAFEKFGDVKELVVVESEIAQDRDVDVIELLRGARFGCDLFPLMLQD